MRRRWPWLLALALAGCGSPAAQPAPPSPAGPPRLGMTPAEVAEILGPPDRETLLRPTEDILEVIWTYKRPLRDFPRGCILTFGQDGSHLTSLQPREIPLTPPRLPPATEAPPTETPLPPLPPEAARQRVEALLGGPETALQAAVDNVMFRFPDCLPFLIEALDQPDRELSPDLRLFLAAAPGQPVDHLRRVHPASRRGLLLDVLTQGTGQHFGIPASPAEFPAIAARWKAWLKTRERP